MVNQAGFNPTKEFSGVPTLFFEESKIVNVSADVQTCGLVLNSLEQVEYALRIYNGEAGVATASSLATNKDMLDNLYQTAGLMGAALGASVSNRKSVELDFVGTMMREARCSIAKNGRYNRDFDYDGMGSSFMKTSVMVNPAHGKYVLRINAAYVGDQPEKDLAALIKAPMAVTQAAVTLELGVLADWWFNLDLAKTLSRCRLFSGFYESVWLLAARDMADHEQGFSFSFFVEHLGSQYKLTLAVMHYKYEYEYRLESGEVETKRFIGAEGTQVRGAAWGRQSSRNKEIKASPKKLCFTIRPASENPDYARSPMVDQRKIADLAGLAEQIKEDLQALMVEPGGGNGSH